MEMSPWALVIGGNNTLTALIDMHYVPGTAGHLIIYDSVNNNGRCHEKRSSDRLRLHAVFQRQLRALPAFSVPFVCMSSMSLKEVRISPKVTRQEGSRARI